MDKYIIAVDAMGGDHAPGETVKGSVQALAENNDIKIILLGIEDKIKQELNRYTYDKDRLEIVHTEEIIETEDNPTSAIKQKKDSSMVVGMNLVKEGRAMALVSAGNSGALLAGSTVIIGRIKGVARPALGTLIPNRKGFTFLIDSGANVDCKPQYLLQFAQIGSIYMEKIMGIKNPRVGLINNGSEKGKGNALTKEAYPYLEECETINFIGNVEARDIPMGAVDVAVCDAFVGNIILKYTEGFAKAIMGMIKDEFMSSFMSKMGALMAKGAFKNLKKRFDYSEVGGAPFLGLKKLVVKAHGSSDAKAIKGAVNQAYIFISSSLNESIEEAVREKDDSGETEE